MTRQPLDYQRATPQENRPPQVRWQTVIAGALLAIALLAVIVALVWARRRMELLAAAGSLGIAGVLIWSPQRRF